MMKKNVIWRAAFIMLSLTLATSSLSLTSAKYITDFNATNGTSEFGVYHLLPAHNPDPETGWGSKNTDRSVYKLDNAPKGYWAFFAQGTHGRDMAEAGRPGSFIGIYYKATAGYFTAGTRTGGVRVGTSSSGSGGACAFIFDNIARPTSNPGNTTGWVVVAGGGGGRGNSASFRGGDAGGQTGKRNAAFRRINGRLIDFPGLQVQGAPDYPNWSDVGFLGGYRATQNDSSTTHQQDQTTDATGTSGGGGGAGLTNYGTNVRGKGGGKGSTNATDGGFFSGGDGSNGGSLIPNTYNSGGGGNGVWGGGGGGSGTNSGGGGGGSSYTGAIAAVPPEYTNPSTYFQHAVNYFWSLVPAVPSSNGACPQTGDGTIILVWLGPVLET